MADEVATCFEDHSMCWNVPTDQSSPRSFLKGVPKAREGLGCVIQGVSDQVRTRTWAPMCQSIIITHMTVAAGSED